MADVGLMYVGAVLFVNALMLLGSIDGKSASVFNIFIGLLQVFTPIYLIITANGDSQLILSASGIFLFGFTYLYVGLTNWFALDTSGVGWYCLWVSVMALGFSYVNFVQFSDVKFGIIWLLWSFLWFLFYQLLGKKRPIGYYVGRVTMIQAWITATIPAFLSLSGYWDNVPSVLYAIISGTAVVYFFSSYWMVRRAQKVTTT